MVLDKTSGKPWFVVADLCKALDVYMNSKGWADATRAIRNLHPDEHSMNSIRRVQKSGRPDNRPMLCVSKSGMFDIILDSRKPSAVAFRKWVTKEVLPTIEETGGYMLKGADRFKIGESLTTGRMPVPQSLAGALRFAADQVEKLAGW